jgi:Protein of unknown function (DUF3800)
MSTSGPNTSAQDQREYIFVDESGDPGFSGGSQQYLLGALHVNELTLDRLRLHLAAFRYHGEIQNEFKATSWADKLNAKAARLLQCLEDFTHSGDIVSTVTWLDKAKYESNNGPYTGDGQTHRLRHYQLRRLLECHRARRKWGTKLDVVLDRWGQGSELKRDLESYLEGNRNLRPEIEHITFVDSKYCDPVQVIDIYLRLAKRVIQGAANADEQRLASVLMHVTEIAGGLY